MKFAYLGLVLGLVAASVGCGRDPANGGGSGGTGGTGGTGGSAMPVDQCTNAADQAIFDELGAAAIGQVAAGCPFNAEAGCGGLTGMVIGLGEEASQELRDELGDCIGACISNETGLSAGCTGCYGAITTCATSMCLDACAAAPGSQECANCSLQNCGFFDDCTGL